MKKVTLPDYEGVDPKPKPAPKPAAPAPGPAFETKRPAVVLSASLPRVERDVQAASDFERISGFSPDVPEIVAAFALPKLTGSTVLAALELRVDEIRARRSQLANATVPADPVLRDSVSFVSEYSARFASLAAALDPRTDHPRLTTSYAQLAGQAPVIEQISAFAERVGAAAPGVFQAVTATKAYDVLLRSARAAVEPDGIQSEIASVGDRVALFEERLTGSLALNSAVDIAVDDVLNVPPERYAQLRARLARAFYELGSSLPSGEAGAALAVAIAREVALAGVDGGIYGEFHANPAALSLAPLQRFKTVGTGVLSLEDAYVDSYQPGQRWFANTALSRDRAQFNSAELRSIGADVDAGAAAAKSLVLALSPATGAEPGGVGWLRAAWNALAPHSEAPFAAVLGRAAGDATLRSAVSTLIASRLTRVINDKRPFALAGDPSRVTPLSEAALRSIEAALTNVAGVARLARHVSFSELRASIYSAAGPLQAAATFVASVLSAVQVRGRDSRTAHSKLSSGSVFCVAVELLVRVAAVCAAASVVSASDDGFDLAIHASSEPSYAAAARRETAALQAAHVLHSYFAALSAEVAATVSFLRSPRAVLSVQRIAAAAGSAARFALQPTQLPLLISALADYELRSRSSSEPDERFAAADSAALVARALESDGDSLVIGVGLPLGFRATLGARVTSASSRGRVKSARKLAIRVSVRDELAPSVEYEPISVEWDAGLHPLRTSTNVDPGAFMVRDEVSMNDIVSVNAPTLAASRAVEVLCSLVLGAELSELSWSVGGSGAPVAAQSEFDAALPADLGAAATDLERAAVGVYVDRARLAAGVLSARVSPLKISASLLSPRKFDRVLWIRLDRACLTTNGERRVPMLGRYSCSVEAA